MPAELPVVLNYASPQPPQWSRDAPAAANTVGQLIALTLGVSVGEALLGLPPHEDGWQADLMIAVIFGVPAALYGFVVFAIVGRVVQSRSVPIAVIAGGVNGLALTGLISGSNVVSERQSDVMAWIGLVLLLIGPIIGAILSRSWRRRQQA